MGPYLPSAAWRTVTTEHLEVAVHWPLGRVPASLIVDDGMPGMNPMIDHEPGRPHRPVVPNEVLRRFVELGEAWGLAGKFSVVPWPLGRGRLDAPDTLPPEARAALPAFLDLVRGRLLPRYDITCEFLTHSRAVDPATGRLLEETERTWASRASAEAFALAFAWAAQILAEVGLPLDGVTSPWDSGRDNEAAYAEGVAWALGALGRSPAWYFLHTEDRSLDVLPRVTYRGPHGLAVSVVASGNVDPGWRTQYGEGPEVEPLVDAEGRGRLAELVAAGLPCVVVTHWQSLYGNGSFGGIQALETLAARLREAFADRLEWVPLRRLAHLAAAVDTWGAEVVPWGRGFGLALRTAFPGDLVELTLRARTREAGAWLEGPLVWQGAPVRLDRLPDGRRRLRLTLAPGTLAPAAA
jgi:hypothetical protein